MASPPILSPHPVRVHRISPTPYISDPVPFACRVPRAGEGVPGAGVIDAFLACGTEDLLVVEFSRDACVNGCAFCESVFE